MQEEHADNAMTGFIKHKKVHKSVLIKTRNQGLKTSVSQNYTHNRSRKRTIQPTSTLSNELDRSFRYIRFCFAGFDIS